MVEHHQQPRFHLGDLAAELGADRATGAGDEDDAVAQVGADAVELADDRLAPEHVLDPDLAQLFVELDAAAEELEDGRQGADGDVAVAAGGDDAAAQVAGGRGDRDHHLVGVGLVEDPLDLLGRAEHLQPQHPHPPLAGVVVDEADRGGAEVGVELQLADHHLAAGAGADDQHLVLGQAGAAARAFDDQPHGEAGAGDQDQGEDEVDHLDRARQRVGEGLGDGEDDDQQGAGDGDSAEDQHEVATADISPPLLVEPEAGEHNQLAGDDEADRLREEDLVAVGPAVRLVEEAQLEGEEIGQRDERGVGRDLQDPVAVDGVVQPAHRTAEFTEP